jgi:hypothetical protein
MIPLALQFLTESFENIYFRNITTEAQLFEFTFEEIQGAS